MADLAASAAGRGAGTSRGAGRIGIPDGGVGAGQAAAPDGTADPEGATLAGRNAGAGLFPIEVGRARAVEVVPDGLWSVMPYRGRAEAVGQALPCGWPAPGRIAEGGGVRAIWSGREAAMVTGARPEGLGGLAAVTDQSDAWVALHLDGPAAGDVLARLVPIDLRERTFPEGSAARTLLGHMGVLILRSGGGFEIHAFRSVAGTLAHELERAMRAVAGRVAGEG